MRKIIISAISQNGVIGKSNGELPWHVKEEFQHFKNTTVGFPVIMGRKTFQSLGKPLKDRHHIVISRNKEFKTEFDSVTVAPSIEIAFFKAARINTEKCFIIGGGEIYKQSIYFADEMILSFMKFDAEGEVKFPSINYNEWEIIKKEDNDLFEIVYFERKVNERN